MSATSKVAMGGGLLLAGVAASAWRVLRPAGATAAGGPGLGSDSDAKEPPQPSPPPSPNNMTSRPRLPPPAKGDRITVLSIDGGGIRGLIPTVILDNLEEHLKDLEKDSEARLADYFDVIAGTSTGGLIAAMLTTPDPDDEKKRGRPKTAAQIQHYYLKNGEKIFSPRGPPKGWLYFVKSFLYGPRYDRTFLEKEIEHITGGKTIGDTLTNIVVPACDIGRLQSVIFSSFKPLADRAQLPLLSHVCIATSAAPTYFPAHHFDLYLKDGKTLQRPYHLIDGGVGANNPTMVAISKITRDVLCKSDWFKQLEGQMDYENMVVISIGTGSIWKKGMKKDDEFYKAEDCAKWGAIGWVWGRKPIIDMFMGASDFLVDLHVSTVMRSHGCDNYLRIQAIGVDKKYYSMDSTDENNMGELLDIGKKLLNRDVYRVSLGTGWYDEYREKKGTKNHQELRDYAIILKQERDKRLERSNKQS